MIDVHKICDEVARRRGLLPKQVYFAFRFHQKHIAQRIDMLNRKPKLPDDFSLESEPMGRDEFKSLYPDIVVPGLGRIVVGYYAYTAWFGRKKRALEKRLRRKEVYSGNRTHISIGYYNRLSYFKRMYEKCENPDKRLRKRYINAIMQLERRRQIVKETRKIKTEEYNAKQNRKGTGGQEDQAAVHKDSDNS